MTYFTCVHILGVYFHLLPLKGYLLAEKFEKFKSFKVVKNLCCNRYSVWRYQHFLLPNNTLGKSGLFSTLGRFQRLTCVFNPGVMVDARGKCVQVLHWLSNESLLCRILEATDPTWGSIARRWWIMGVWFGGLGHLSRSCKPIYVVRAAAN